MTWILLGYHCITGARKLVCWRCGRGACGCVLRRLLIYVCDAKVSQITHSDFKTAKDKVLYKKREGDGVGGLYL